MNFNDLDRTQQAILFVLYRAKWQNLKKLTLREMIIEITNQINNEKLLTISNEEFRERFQQAIKENDKYEVEQLLNEI